MLLSLQRNCLFTKPQAIANQSLADLRSPAALRHRGILTTFHPQGSLRRSTKLNAKATPIQNGQSEEVPVSGRRSNFGDSTAPQKQPSKPILKPSSKNFKRLLCIDGGILKGIVAARALEGLENAIKAALIDEGQAKLDDQTFSDMNEFDIDLADWFDVIAGTSTGSILATYLASKGRTSANFLKNDVDIDFLGRQQPTMFQSLRAGSSRAAQAMYIAKAEKIFPAKNRFKVWEEKVLPLLKSYASKIDMGFYVPRWLVNKIITGKIDQLGMREAETLEKTFKVVVADLFECKFPGEPLEEVLKGVFADASFSDGMYTSLLVPMYELNLRRPAAFWYSFAHQTYGLATLKRALGAAAISTAIAANKRQVLAGPPSNPPLLLPDKPGSAMWAAGIDFKLWQLPNASSRAPTYLPAARLQVPGWWIDEAAPQGSTVDIQAADGGLAANDPCAVAAAFALEEGVCIDKMAVISIGCGNFVSSAVLRDQDAGQLSWILGPLLDILTSGNEELSPLLVEKLIGTFDVAHLQGRYLRVQTSFVRQLDGSFSGDVQLNARIEGKPVLASEALAHPDDPKYALALLEVGKRMAEDHAARMKAFAKQYLIK